ncbi:MAG TPA: glucose-6-phosphate dehydrogenase, partial [Casimicrobiaceae bacterium]|nr:glucose-6-phosphate dehydrogenase [Casimicrobiaceae bacterium]
MTQPSASAASRAADPCILVIFGALGDLAARLLLPALYNLDREHLLPDAFAIVGVARAATTRQQFQNDAREALHHAITTDFDPGMAEALIARMSYVQGDLNDNATYARLADALAAVQGTAHIPGNYLF